jgi:hypothetical protein
MEYYNEEATSSMHTDSQQSCEQYEEDEEFCRYQKDQIYAEVDFLKRKTKICCSIG